MNQKADKKSNPLPSVDRLRELLDYNPLTGDIRWKVAKGSIRVGSIAGYVENTGYRRIRIDGAMYLAARIAWKMTKGKDPVATIDHKNHIKTDNRIENLREATASQQCRSRRSFKGSSSRYLGVSWITADQNWLVQIKADGRSRNIGRFSCETAAALAYDAAAIAIHGEFANPNLLKSPDHG